MINFLIAKDKFALASMAADFILTQIKNTLAVKNVCAIALAGGSTPKETYRIIAQHPDSQVINWDRVHFFWGDERMVSPGHTESNYLMAWKSLLAPLGISPKNIFRIHGEKQPEEAANEYKKIIGGVLGEPPIFDLILLGMGDDGHTASLFPQSKALDEQHKIISANWVEMQKKWRITFTAPLINQAKQVAFLVSGNSKANAIKEIVEGKHKPSAFPAQLIKPKNGTLTWLLDEAAAQHLTKQ